MPFSSRAGATSGSHGNNASSIIVGAGAGTLSSSGNYESPFPTSTGLPATSAQLLGSGSDLSVMAGQTIVMITLAHDRHGPGSVSLPTGTDTITMSSLTLSSANTMSASAASNTDDCGVVQSFYGQTAASWEAMDMDAWLNVWFSTYSSAISANSYGLAGWVRCRVSPLAFSTVDSVA